MHIEVRVRPNSREAKIEKLTEGIYKVWVKEPPEQGKANTELVQLLADHFGVEKAAITILGGKGSLHKFIAVE